MNLPAGQGRPGFKILIRALREGVLAIILPIFILGSILGGIATPTEAAAIAVAYSLVVGGLVYRALSCRDLYEIGGVAPIM